MELNGRTSPATAWTVPFSRNRPPTILAGAGLSAVAPTCFPGWWALNDAVLEALGDAVERVTGRSGLSSSFRSVVAQRRDTTPFLKPDLQAQLLEDEIGDAYFRALACVDSEVPNPAHDLIARLAGAGRIGAIVTTNFDCTIERALDARGVAYRAYCAPDHFEQLAAHASGLALVKVHGSATMPSTMVDTLRQRLHGRPMALTKWMHTRFSQFPTVALGFSAEDLQYERNYLSIRPALESGAEFRFLVRANTKPSAPLAELERDFAPRVIVDYGELPRWLFELVTQDHTWDCPSEPMPIPTEDADRIRSASRHKLRMALHEWAASLGRMEVLNAVTALLASAGQRSTADHLLERTWTFYREPGDCHGQSYARYLCNYGETLLRRARLRNPHDRRTELAEWKRAADEDPTQFFFRAYELGRSDAALARRLLCQFLAGAPVSSISGASTELFQRLVEAGNEGILSLSSIDAAFSLAELLEYVGAGHAATGILELAYRSAAEHGDEFRRAEGAWRLARNMSFNLEADPGRAARIDELAADCTDIARRLDIRESDAGAALARAIAGLGQHRWDDAMREARRAETVYTEIEDALGVLHARREQVRALIGKAQETGNASANEFDRLSLALQTFAGENAPGLRTIVKFELANVALNFDVAFARQLAVDVCEDARLQQHPVAGRKAMEIIESIDTRGGRDP